MAVAWKPREVRDRSSACGSSDLSVVSKRVRRCGVIWLVGLPGPMVECRAMGERRVGPKSPRCAVCWPMEDEDGYRIDVEAGKLRLPRGF